MTNINTVFAVPASANKLANKFNFELLTNGVNNIFVGRIAYALYDM
ncbi:hypothetical protein EDC16_101297 [Testudinibacter aquarius]|uniref:Uncharacterized protein n=1 Tax=Testudinibacter aquarius TaxID=1524974 RepID=A0A4R3YGB3_9PAST|nr:hypothetical protein EDC16_101297 [Testudinibacter aquarius]